MRIVIRVKGMMANGSASFAQAVSPDSRTWLPTRVEITKASRVVKDQTWCRISPIWSVGSAAHVYDPARRIVPIASHVAFLGMKPK